MSDSSTNSPNPAIPTGAQLAESRLKQWHQQGEALLTIENLRSWINAAGLVLFAPRPQIVSPAPSLVEAVLGASNPNPTLAQTVESRSLLARLVAEGLAVPLNLLGATNGVIGETPDFVASTAVFSYVFTLRGDKAWKQPPETTGALKVSHLALATHEALAKGGPLSAYDLTTEVGKEVTEAAVLRALGELWTHLRVLPLPQPDGKPTIWELASTRFTKQIKAGANAGQPSALSALISLYLGQAVVASEEEIESYLSPLASRSRIRDVIHALLAARQLETIAVEGRTMLHVAGELPAFLAPAVVEAQPDEIAVTENATGEADATGEAAPRITKYVPKPRKVGTGYLAKASPSKFGARPASPSKFGGSKPVSRFGAKPGFKSTPAPDRERRPFSKPGIDYAARGFDKPWEEEKARRLAAASKPSDVEVSPLDLAASEGSGEAETQPRAPRVYKPREDSGSHSNDRRGARPSFGSKPAFRGKPSFGGKPSFDRKSSFGDSRPPRRDFAPRAEGESTGARPPRKTFSKPGTFGRKREGFAGKPSFGDSRPPRRDFAPRGDRPAFDRPRAPGSYTPRPKSDRPGGFKSDRPGGFKSARPGGFKSDRGEGSSFAPRKPYPPRGAGFFSGQPRAADNRGDRPARPDTGPRERPDRSSTTESGKRVYRKFDAPRERPDRTDRPARPFSSDRPGKPSGDFAPRKFTGKPTGKPGSGKKTFTKSAGTFTGRPESTFAKFAGNKKPFGKRPPARKFKPKGGESA